MALMAMWQGLGSDAISSGNTRWLMIFVGLVAASMVAQVIIFAFMAYGAKKAQEFDSTLTDANQRAKAHVARVDKMVSTGLTATGALAEMIHQGIRKPVIEITGLVNGIKAGIEVLTSRAKGFAGRSRVTRNDVEY